MTDKIDAMPARYTINKDDIEGMMRSSAPGETVSARVWTHPELKTLGWLIEITRPIYGEEYVHHSFVALALVSEGPDWVEEQHRLIDTAFEATRKEHPKSRH